MSIFTPITTNRTKIFIFVINVSRCAVAITRFYAEVLARVIFTTVIGKPMKEELAMAEDVSAAEVDGSKIFVLPK